MIYVVKRDGREVPFNSIKITNAIERATDGTSYNIKKSEIIELTQKVMQRIETLDKKQLYVEEIQDIVEKVLLGNGYTLIGIAFSDYRQERNKTRGIKSDLMKFIEKIGIETDRDNANVGNNYSSKLLRIASESNKWHNLSIMPKYLSKAHENGDVYYHDLDSYNLTINCLHIPTKEVLEKGFNTDYGYIRKAKGIVSAAALSCILLQSTQNDMFGGQSHPNFDNDMASFVKYTRQEIIQEIIELGVDENKIEVLAERKLRKSIEQSMRGIVYTVNTMHSRMGSQVPFSSMNIGIPESKDAALVCEIFLTEYEKGLGKGEQPIFPNIIFRVKKGVNREKSDPYHYLYTLACRVASRRMNPTFMNLDSDFNKFYYDQGIIPATMGCRTYVCSNVNGEEGPKGRGNIAPVTINLPRIGILAKGSVDEFYKLLDNKLQIARESLMHRYDVLKKLKVKDLPFVAGQGLILGSEGLTACDSIEPILKNGSWCIGFIGLAETLVALTGKHHAECEESRKLGVEIIAYIRNYTDKLTEETKLNWSTYATPAEGLSGKFVLKDKALFGEIQGVTDKVYYTNSYHVPVKYLISIKEKIDIEAPYHKLCNGGHISYIELDDYPTGEIIMDILDYAYKQTNISYMGINFHIRYCKDCGSYLQSGANKCMKCGSRNIQGISRVTGYLSLDERFSSGKTAERSDRISHTTNHTTTY
ncbi:anaerobic ribonucleoside-triphosphate reductase [Clostridium akagii]|uniref:anaerobic ribonucleoside-triphosphate reductase n=1 Tax=Clostridium akagii TaxID=91623 RepID=UPI00047A0EE8|nr:anaerobic ribonucleoside-triphosphate reductase [Clostridium akagii]